METNWIEIQKKFDAFNDINDIFYFLRSLIDQLQVCNSTECEIYPALHTLDLARSKFQQKSLFSIKEASVNIKNQIELKRFEDDYWEFILKAKSVFSKLFALKTSHQTKEKEHKQYFDEYCKTLTIINDNNYPMPLQVQNSTQMKMNEITAGAIGLDDKLQEKRKEFEKFMREEKLKNKKETKEKKKDEKESE